MADIREIKANVEKLRSQIVFNIEKRKIDLDNDYIKSITVIENVQVSRNVASIAGIEKCLNRMRQAKQKREAELTIDIHSHATQTIGECRRMA
jgi:hypothetical protein